jgi:hypothetical protein
MNPALKPPNVYRDKQPRLIRPHYYQFHGTAETATCSIMLSETFLQEQESCVVGVTNHILNRNDLNIGGYPDQGVIP